MKNYIIVDGKLSSNHNYCKKRGVFFYNSSPLFSHFLSFLFCFSLFFAKKKKKSSRQPRLGKKAGGGLGLNLKRSWKGRSDGRLSQGQNLDGGIFLQNDCQMFHQKIVEIVGQVERSLGENPLTRGTDKTISIAPANCQKELIHQKKYFFIQFRREILFYSNVILNGSCIEKR